MLKLVTFNIRCDYDQDGANSFRFRKPVILKKLADLLSGSAAPCGSMAEGEPDGIYRDRLWKK